MLLVCKKIKKNREYVIFGGNCAIANHVKNKKKNNVHLNMSMFKIVIQTRQCCCVAIRLLTQYGPVPNFCLAFVVSVIVS